MKKRKILSAIIGFFLIDSASYAEYKIDACSIPLKDIIISEAKIFVGNIMHVFVRGNDGTGYTGLNFEPEKPWGFLGGKAQIGRQNYPSANCETILSTKNKDDYQREWDRITRGYEEYAKTRLYSIGGLNCQHVTKSVLNNLGYRIPKSIKKDLDF